MSDSEVLSKLARFKEWLVYGLVFLFPIAGVSVQHWFSSIFVLLVLISLWDLVKYWGRRSELFKEEKIWLWLCVGFFLSFVISGLVNGWGKPQTRYLGVDIRYLLVVPLYLMLRQYPYAWRYLLAGLFFAAIVLAGQAYYDVFESNMYRAQGFYSPNLMGPVAALVALWLISSWRLWGVTRWLLPVFVLAALWAMAMSGSRGAYLGLLAMLLVWLVVCIKGWWRLPALAVILAIPVVAYNSLPSVKQRVDVAVSEVGSYFEQLEQDEHYTGGSAVRFEMWRGGWMVFEESPVLGIGRGNYTEVVQRYVEEGKLPAAVAQHGHAHNAYIDVLMSRGLIGFVIFLGMLFYPLYFFWKTRKISPGTAIFGILQVVGYAVFSLTDASTFIMGNFTAIFLLCMTVFFSWHTAKVYAKRGTV